MGDGRAVDVTEGKGGEWSRFEAVGQLLYCGEDRRSGLWPAHYTLTFSSYLFSRATRLVRARQHGDWTANSAVSRLATAQCLCLCLHHVRGSDDHAGPEGRCEETYKSELLVR